MRISYVATIALLLMKAWHAEADLYQTSDPYFGPNSVTVDTSSELGWLNLSFTTDLSYDQVIADTQPGGILSSYRFATVPEVIGLFNSAGIPATGYYPQSTPAIPYLISLIGTTGLINGEPGFIARSGTWLSNQGQYSPSIYLFDVNMTPTYRVSDGDAVGTANSGPDLGNWLVKEVPEPADTGFLALASAVLVGFRIVQQRKKSEA